VRVREMTETACGFARMLSEHHGSYARWFSVRLARADKLSCMCLGLAAPMNSVESKLRTTAR